MTAIPSPSGSAPQAQGGAFGGRSPILLAFPDRAPQQRLSVLLRIFLALPHLIALAVLSFVAEIVAVIGWFGALFTGRLPRFAEDYLSGWLHWQARVNSYCLLLTGAYPPFALGDSDYPVRLAVPPPGPLNRLAVFFRIILAIPATVLVMVLGYGAQTIMLFVTWLVVLVTGIMPAELYQAYAAVIRYSIRYIGYMALLTGEYPNALFGDRPTEGEVVTGAANTFPAHARRLPGPARRRHSRARRFHSAAGERIRRLPTRARELCRRTSRLPRHGGPSGLRDALRPGDRWAAMAARAVPRGQKADRLVPRPGPRTARGLLHLD